MKSYVLAFSHNFDLVNQSHHLNDFGSGQVPNIKYMYKVLRPLWSWWCYRKQPMKSTETRQLKLRGRTC